MEKIQEFIKSHIVDVFMFVAVMFFIVGCWCLYTASRTANDYNNIHDTVQSVESDNQQARQQINSAAGKVESAEKQLNDSIKRTGEITNRVNNAKKRIDGNTEIVRECNDIIDAGRADSAEARRIFADIDKRNKENGTQADSNA